MTNFVTTVRVEASEAPEPVICNAGEISTSGLIIKSALPMSQGGFVSIDTIDGTYRLSVAAAVNTEQGQRLTLGQLTDAERRALENYERGIERMLAQRYLKSA